MLLDFAISHLAQATTLPEPTTRAATAAARNSDTLIFSVDAVLSPYIYVFYGAFLVSLLFTPVMRAIALHYNIIDRPDLVRKLHKEPIAYLGGVAIFLGWLAGLVVSQLVYIHAVSMEHPEVRSVQVNFSIVLGGFIIVVLGLFDDIRSIKPTMKITGQVLAAVVLLAMGIGDDSMKPILDALANRVNLVIYGAGKPEDFMIPIWLENMFSAGLVITLVVFCCNATNLMDGLDGLCGGVTGIIALGYVFLAIHLARTGFGDPNADALRIVLALALLGGVLGFIPYNFNPASIFMGDTGSMFIGFSIATLIAMMAEESSKWLLAAMVMFALPILDTSLAFVRRYVNGRPFFSPDKHHVHHQVLARGLTVKQTVLFLYGAATIFCLLGASIAFMRTRYAVAAYLVVFGFIVVAAYKMGMVHETVKVDKPNPIGSDDKIKPTAEIDTSQVLEVSAPPKTVAEPV